MSSIACANILQDIVIGTPGRLKDLVEEGVCCLSEVAFVVSGQPSDHVSH